ncbi:MAG: HAMP domain-containing sensor histidine kinase, partial [bacterium]|nr:HAMP domain-containing sensor histidine kinase [bacterium]
MSPHRQTRWSSQPKAPILRLVSVLAVLLIDISFLMALDTLFVSQKRALIHDSMEEFNELANIVEPLRKELAYIRQTNRPDNYMEKAKQYLDANAATFLAGEHPWYQLILTDDSNTIQAVYTNQQKLALFNNAKNCLFSRTFHAPVRNYSTKITLFYATPQGWPEIEAMVRRYWLYAILFVTLTWLGYWWLYRTLFMPLQRVGSAIETMIRADSIAMIPNPKHAIEEAFNQLARNQREVLLGLSIDHIVDALHDQPDDLAILEEYLRHVVEPIQKMYPFAELQAYRALGANNQYRLLSPNGPSTGQGIRTLSATDPHLLFLCVGGREYGALRWTPLHPMTPREEQMIAQEISKQTENGLARALTRSRALTEERNRFGINLATNMGHDLTNIIATGKWDLNTIKRALDLGLVSMEETKGKFFKEAVEGLKSNLHFLQEMVNIYRAFGYARSPRYEEIDLTELIHDISRLFLQSTSKKIQIQFEPAASLSITAEPRLLRMALFNLLGNAAQAMQRQDPPIREGLICIRLMGESGLVTLTVSDNGPGIRSPQGVLLQAPDINQIFQSGFTTKDSHSGGGLGLAWVKSIVEEFHHGTIHASNLTEGGACITIHL